MARIPRSAERLQELIPGSDLLVLPETGHFAMEDSPQEVEAALFDFFSDCSATYPGGSLLSDQRSLGSVDSRFRRNDWRGEEMSAARIRSLPKDPNHYLS